MLKKNRLILTLAFCMLALAACSGTSKHAARPVFLPTVRLTVLPDTELQRGRPVKAVMKLTDIKTGNLLTDADLETAHTQKIHLLIIDPTLTDYHHVHPVPAGTPGLYRFTFTPKLSGGYRVWADITPKATGREEFDMAQLGPRHEAAARTAANSSATVDGYHFELEFDKPPTVDGESTGTVHITRRGHPVTLGLVMGAHAHIAAFFNDYRAVMHVHPMGNDTHKIMFHFAPDRPGFVKLFVQVNIGGREITAPFGVRIKS